MFEKVFFVYYNRFCKFFETFFLKKYNDCVVCYAMLKITKKWVVLKNLVKVLSLEYYKEDFVQVHIRIINKNIGA